MNSTHDNPATDFARRFVLYISFSCLVIGILSLSLAYLCGGRAWNGHFGRLEDPTGMPVGYWIELARLILIVGLSAFVLGDGFSDELQQLFRLRSSRSESPGRKVKAWVIAFRCFFVVLVLVLAITKSSEVFNLSENGAPAQLIQWAFDPQHEIYDRDEIAEIEQIWREVQRAYILYTPYAQVIYAVFLPLMITVPLFAVITSDVRYLSSTRHLSIGRFAEFRNECYRRAMRYLNLYAAVSIVLLFLQWDPVLTDREHEWVRAMAYSLSVVAAIFFVYVWMIYHDYWYRASSSMEDEEAGRKFATANAPLDFFKSMFKQPLPGLAIASLGVMLLRSLVPALT